MDLGVTRLYSLKRSFNHTYVGHVSLKGLTLI
ncbi:UNVERIFIED_ORG: hypothetical protein GGI57_003895 [Rhizobium aethiopicum]